MTENEAKTIDDCLKELKDHRDVYLKRSTPWRVVNRAVRLIEELKLYRAIGTVEEFKKCKEELELYRNLDKTNYHDGYRSAIDDVVCKISDYKEKHYHNRAEYPINYGLLCDMENWFLEMKGEKQ